MPLVAHNQLPTYERLRRDGHVVLDAERAKDQDIRPLHVGLLNMMPDAALTATERQFFRLVGSSNPISQFYIHPFTLDAIPRSMEAREYIDAWYEPLEVVMEQGLDALIITGANVTKPDLSLEVFWQPLGDVIAWADRQVTSTLCSCLSSHAVLLHRHGIERRGLAKKCWGIFNHEVKLRDHPLVHDVNTLVSAPHSRFNEISREQLEGAGLHVIIEGDEPGVQCAVSPDGFRTIFFQGHPEYDTISLMKEYKRDTLLHLEGKLPAYPPFPLGYFDDHVQALLGEYRLKVEQALARGESLPRFPEHLVKPHLHNTWHDSGEAIVGNWIGLVYQLTHAERTRPYMNGIDRDDPLGWLERSGLPIR